MNHRSVNKVSKTRVLKAALNLFSSRGYAETKMTGIAKAAGISVGALYLRFESKEKLCLELIRDQTKDFHKLTENLQVKDPLKSLKTYINLNLEFALKKKQMLSILMREHRLSFIRPIRKHFLSAQQKIIRNILVSGAKKHIFRKADTKQTAYMIFACIRGTILLKHVFGVGDVKTMSNTLYKLITDGLKRGAL